MTTVVLDEKLREEGEQDSDFAVRIASVFMREYYNFDVEAVANSIGIVDEEGIQIDE